MENEESRGRSNSSFFQGSAKPANGVSELLASISDDDPMLLKIMNMANKAAVAKQNNATSLSTDLDAGDVLHSRTATVHSNPNMGSSSTAVEQPENLTKNSSVVFQTTDDSWDQQVHKPLENQSLFLKDSIKEEDEEDTSIVSGATLARVHRCKEYLEEHYVLIFKTVENMEEQWRDLAATGVVKGTIEERFCSPNSSSGHNVSRFVQRFTKNDRIKQPPRHNEHDFLRKSSILLLGVTGKTDSAALLAAQNAEDSISELQWNPLAVIRWRRSMWQKAVKANHFEEIRKWKPKTFVWDLTTWEIEAYAASISAKRNENNAYATEKPPLISPTIGPHSPNVAALSSSSALSKLKGGADVKNDNKKATYESNSISEELESNANSEKISPTIKSPVESAASNTNEALMSTKSSISTPIIAISAPQSPENPNMFLNNPNMIAPNSQIGRSLFLDKRTSIGIGAVGLSKSANETKKQARSMSPSILGHSSSSSGVPANILSTSSASSPNASTVSFKEVDYALPTSSLGPPPDDFSLSPRFAKGKRSSYHRKSQSLHVSMNPSPLNSQNGSPLILEQGRSISPSPEPQEPRGSGDSANPNTTGVLGEPKTFNKSLVGISSTLGDAAQGAYGTLSRAAKDTKEFLSNSTASKTIKTSVAKAVKRTTPQMRKLKHFVGQSGAHESHFSNVDAFGASVNPSSSNKFFGRSSHRRTLSEMPHGAFSVADYSDNDVSLPSSPHYARIPASNFLPPLPQSIDESLAEPLTEKPLEFRLTADETFSVKVLSELERRLRLMWDDDTVLLDKTKMLLIPIQVELEKSEYRLGWVSPTVFTLISKTGVLYTSEFLRYVQIFDVHESQLTEKMRALELQTLEKEEKVSMLLGHIDNLTEKLNQQYFQQLCEIQDAFHELSELSRRASYVRWAQELLYSSLAGLLSLAGSFVWVCFQIFKASRWTSTSIWTLFRHSENRLNQPN